MLVLHIGMPVQVLPIPFPMQLPVHVPGKPAEDGTSPHPQHPTLALVVIWGGQLVGGRDSSVPPLSVTIPFKY